MDFFFFFLNVSKAVRWIFLIFNFDFVYQNEVNDVLVVPFVILERIDVNLLMNVNVALVKMQNTVLFFFIFFILDLDQFSKIIFCKKTKETRDLKREISIISTMECF